MDPGATFGPYRVLEKLGAGGMGEVYLAQDERLPRKVALKVLPPIFANDADRVRRFEQEARAVSALNHPNILTLFDLGREGDRYYMATEFVDGSTLRAHLAEHGRLPPAEAIAIAVQCAAALSTAHRAGIVHRDIKPENVMLRHDGYVKVLDFGLAKTIERAMPEEITAPAAPNLTSAGAVLGTVGYLSPEQARGQPVDARTDVFSLGVMLYEMLAGRRPFAGATPADTLAAILRAEAPSIALAVPAAPAGLDAVLGKALAKDLAARYAVVEEFGHDLEAIGRDLAFATHSRSSASTSVPARGLRRRLHHRALLGAAAALVILAGSFMLWRPTGVEAPPSDPAATAAGSQRVRSLAVLPFRLFGYAATDEHLGIGMADALIIKLTSLRQLTVRPTTAVLKYQGEQDVQAIARALQVDGVLVGTVQRAAGRVRVTVQLIGAPAAGATAESIWSDEFTTTTEDPFEVQDRLTAQLVQKLAVQITGDEQTRLTSRDTTSRRALQLYMEGRYFLTKSTVDSYQRSLELFGEAVDEDPRYARAHYGQVLAWNRLIENGALPLAATMSKVRAGLARTLELDPGLAEAYGLRSLLSRVYDWKFDEADTDSQRSMDLEPNNPWVLQWRGVHLLAFGRSEEAVAQHLRAVEIDPIDFAVRAQLCRALYLAHRYEQAIQTAQSLLELDPTHSAARQFMGLSLAATGQLDEAIQVLKAAVEAAPGNAERRAGLAYVYALAGQPADARKIIAELQAPRVGVPNAYHIATIYAGLGDRPSALQWLDHAWENHDGFLANRVKLDPKLDPLREEPRFRALLKRMLLDGR
jgi:eukaryotic-like serine/threonine-protein kinase